MRSSDNRDTWVELSRINGSCCIGYQAFNYRSELEKHCPRARRLRLYAFTIKPVTVRLYDDAQMLQPGYSATVQYKH